MNNKNMRTILGIDPGYGRIGIGVICQNGARLTCTSYECLAPPQTPLPDRLLFIHQSLKELLQRYSPSIVAVEKIYFFKNITTAIDVSQARGVILLTARLFAVPLYEYTPLQVKCAVTGYGKASKQQVQKMVQILLSLPSLPKPDDAADALAVAVCASTAAGKFLINP